jgi:MFS family permease
LCALSILFFSSNAPYFALFLFFLFFLWQGLGEGIVVIAWQDLLAKIFPINRRGRFFGISGFFESILSVVGASLAAYILITKTFPYNFAYLFLLTFFGLCIAWIFLALIREPSKPPIKEKVIYKEYFRKLPELISQDKNFRSFLISRIFLGFGRMGIGFLIIFGILQWQLTDSFVGKLTVILFVAQMIASLSLGFMADRKGHRLNIIIGLLSLMTAMVMTVLGHQPWILYFVFILVGIDKAIETLSAQIIVFEFAQEENRPTYIGIASTVAGVFGGVSPIIGGLIYKVWGYQTLFLTALILLFISFVVMITKVKEPRLI